MRKLSLVSAGLLTWLLFGPALGAQPVYYSTSSTVISKNILGSVTTNSSGGNPVLFTAGGAVSRCTALAVDGLNGKLFFIDTQSNALWSVNLNGGGLALVRNGLAPFLSDLALDVLNQRIYLASSSTVQGNNTIQSLSYSGAGLSTVLAATGPAGNGVSRCTALALDLAHSKIFLADAGAQRIWSMSLAGSGLEALASISDSFPTGLALDTAGQQVYFTAGAAEQAANSIQRVNYDGSGLTTLFNASGGVERCTALDLDLQHGTIYLSDAGANALWRLPLAGGSPALLATGLPATPRKVRWYSGPASRPPPGLTGFQISGTNAVFNATNGFVGGTYYVLTSTNVVAPLSQWVPIVTNVLSDSGGFTLTATNAVASGEPRRFFILAVH